MTGGMSALLPLLTISSNSHIQDGHNRHPNRHLPSELCENDLNNPSRHQYTLYLPLHTSFSFLLQLNEYESSFKLASKVSLYRNGGGVIHRDAFEVPYANKLC
jgi:hypothetical protein